MWACRWPDISIHALLAESDSSQTRTTAQTTKFLSTLSLRRATISIALLILPIKFLSTLSLRRATADRYEMGIIRQDFYPRSPCGERPARVSKALQVFLYFYPRSPCGERPANWFDLWGWRDISIHALLAESDPIQTKQTEVYIIFLSTLSLRRATCLSISKRAPAFYFYPRSPCGERPSIGLTYDGLIAYFYPRSPCGERRYPLR